MKEIYSKVKQDVLLHIVHRKSEITEERNDLISPQEFLQVSTLCLPKNKIFRPHKHRIVPKYTTTTQESWVVIRGKVRAILYDLDDRVIAEEELRSGDISVTLYGGHNYVALEENTLVYEFKTGPYLGQEKDKRFIDEVVR